MKYAAHYMLIASLAANIFLVNKTAKAYTNDSIHQWATDQVTKAFPNDPWGPYDICATHAMWVKPQDNKLYSEGKVDGYVDMGQGPLYIALDNTTSLYSEDAENACAVILNGAEW